MDWGLSMAHRVRKGLGTEWETVARCELRLRVWKLAGTKD
jgi:hypothetical protein